MSEKRIDPLFDQPKIEVTASVNENKGYLVSATEKTPLSPLSGQPMQLAEVGVFGSPRVIKAWISIPDRIAFPVREN